MTDAGSDTGTVVTPPPISLANGLAISEIAFYETVKIDVMKDGAEVLPYNAPLLTDRRAIVRVFTKIAMKGYKPRSIKGELHIVSGNGDESVLTDTRTLSISSEDRIESTLTFNIDLGKLDFGQSFYVVLEDTAAKTPEGAKLRWPEDGSQILYVTKNPGPVAVRMVPVQYDADMSGRLPDTSDNQLNAIKTTLYDYYPTSQIQIDVRQTPIVWTKPINPDGTGWVELVQAILDARAKDNPPSTTYYVGAFLPRATFGQYCQQGCIAGLASTADPAVPAERGVAVLGYTGLYGVETIVHEIGHVMGRHHSPCGGAQGTDPKYPYSDGSIGVPGWRQSDGALMPDASDIMGYCQPYWISDFTYSALASRIKTVNAQGSWNGPKTPHVVQRILVDSKGSLSWGNDLSMTEVVGGNDVEVRYFDSKNVLVAKANGKSYGYDHVAGGFVLVMDPPNVPYARASVLGASLAR